MPRISLYLSNSQRAVVDQIGQGRFGDLVRATLNNVAACGHHQAQVVCPDCGMRAPYASSAPVSPFVTLTFTYDVGAFGDGGDECGPAVNTAVGGSLSSSSYGTYSTANNTFTGS
jgi:hypothetical protein